MARLDEATLRRTAEVLHRYGLQGPRYQRQSGVRRRASRFVQRKMRGLGWLVLVGKPYRTEDGQTKQDIRIRYWHPGLWWEVAKTIRIKPGPQLYALRTRFWEIASDLTLGLSGWVAARYAAAVNDQASTFTEDGSRCFRCFAGWASPSDIAIVFRGGIRIPVHVRCVLPGEIVDGRAVEQARDVAGKIDNAAL